MNTAKRAPGALVRRAGLQVMLLFGTAMAAACVEPDSGAEAALDRVSAETLRAHVAFLADDLLKGRMTGTPEYDIAARYVASQLEAVGLEPGGKDGTWYQEVPYRAAHLDIGSAQVVIHGASGDEALEWKADFIMGGDDARARTEVRAPVVFVGYGVHAPEAGYDDYAGVDVRGKIVAWFRGAPAGFPHNERAFYSSGLVKRQEAVSRGAVGIISLETRERLEKYTWERLSRNAGTQPYLSWLDPSGEPADYFPEIEGSVILGPTGAAALFRGAGTEYEALLDAEPAGKLHSFALPVEVTLARNTSHEPTRSPNVIGLLRGSDPRLRDEYVVYTAHLDHVGIGAEVDGDAIYNGAYDNAMGVAILIETARALAALPAPPRRSILFVAVGGEERGLLGSDYFAHYPTVPLESIVANVNLDMPLFTWPPADLVAFGAEHSSLAEPVRMAAEAEGFTLSPDPMPEEVVFVRSDQYSLVRQGIPAVFLISGLKSADPSLDGSAAFRDFLTTHYHQPSDDLRLPVHWESAVHFTRANARIGYLVAQADARPAWNEGDFFGGKFGR
jgi:hypothetical protein